MSLDALWAEVDRGGMWPILRDVIPQQKLQDRRALAQTIVQNEQPYFPQVTLPELAGWKDLGRRYHADPLAQTITRAFADGLFGSRATITTDDPRDQERLDQIRRVSELDSELHRAARISTGEGEAWWHVFRDSTLPTPTLAFESRRFVLPWLSGRRVVACLFASTYQLAAEPDTSDPLNISSVSGGPNYRVLRVFEGHGVGIVQTRAYVGTWTTIGGRVPLDQYEASMGLADEWDHGLGIILAGRIINESGDNHYLGVSEFDSVQQLLLDLDEARAIGAENARLTAKKRAIVRGELTSAVTTDPVTGSVAFDAGADIIQLVDDGLGDQAASAPLTILEYKYDSAALIAHAEALEATILARRGIVSYYSSIVQHTTRSESGTALRLKLIPTEQAINAHGREWDEQLQQGLTATILVDQSPIASAAAGVDAYPWESVASPTVERGDAIPIDMTEVIANAALKFTSLMQSLEETVAEIHPLWTDTQVEDEVAAIQAGEAAKIPQLPAEFDDTHDPATPEASAVPPMSGRTDVTFGAAKTDPAAEV